MVAAFRILLSLVFVISSSFAEAKLVAKPAKPTLPIAESDFYKQIVNSLKSRLNSGRLAEMLPEHFSKADRERVLADYNRDPKLKIKAKGRKILIRDGEGNVISLQLKKFGPKKVKLEVNGKPVTLKADASYREMKKTLIGALDGKKSASYPWLQVLPQAEAVTIVGAAAIIAVIIAGTWLSWGMLRHLARCLRRHVGNRRLAPGQWLKELERGGAVFGCIVSGSWDDALELISDLRRAVGASGSIDLPQMSGDFDEYEVTPDGIYLRQAEAGGEPGGQPDEGSGARETAGTSLNLPQVVIQSTRINQVCVAT